MFLEVVYQHVCDKNHRTRDKSSMLLRGWHVFPIDTKEA